MLYKYFAEDRIDVVEDMAIRFSPLKSLNDPFESLPLIRLGGEIDTVMNEANLELDKFWEDQDEKTEETRKEVDDAWKELKDFAGEVASPNSVGAGFIEQLADRFGVLCLSRTNRNLLMWSHYTNNGKGYVIEFEEQHAFFHQEDMGGRLTKPSQVVYSTQRQVVDSKDELQREKLLCRKSIDWSYEEEERIFRVFAPSCEVIGSDDYGQDIIVSDVPADAVRAVYIGYNASNETIARLCSAAPVNFRECPVFRSRICPTEYRILFDQVESG